MKLCFLYLVYISIIVLSVFALVKNKSVEQGEEKNGHTVVSDAAQVSGGAAEM